MDGHILMKFGPEIEGGKIVMDFGQMSFVGGNFDLGS